MPPVKSLLMVMRYVSAHQIRTDLFLYVVYSMQCGRRTTFIRGQSRQMACVGYRHPSCRFDIIFQKP